MESRGLTEKLSIETESQKVYKVLFFQTPKTLDVHGIRFNCVCPGAVTTNMVSEEVQMKTLYPEDRLAMVGRLALVAQLEYVHTVQKYDCANHDGYN
jgi:hypothetical protein